MSRRHILAIVAVGAFGVGFGGACGNDDSSRQSIENSNDKQDVPKGSPGTVQTNPDALTSTGEEQPEVTQPETSP
jgi:hypothetical protein